MKKYIVVLLLIISFVFIGCNQKILKKNIEFNEEIISISIDEEADYTLKLTEIYNQDNVEVISLNEDIAIIENGKVKGINEGETSIKAFLKDDESVNAILKIIVIKKDIDKKELKFDEEMINLYIDEEKDYNLEVCGINDEKNIEIVSLNENIAIIENGKIKGINEGETSIKAFLKDDESIYTILKVIIVKKEKTEKVISFKEKKLFIDVNDSLVLNINCEGIEDLSEIEIKVENEEIAMVIDCEIYGMSVGYTVVTAYLKEDKSIYSSIEVVVENCYNDLFFFYRDNKTMIENTTSSLGLFYKEGYCINDLEVEMSCPDIVVIENEMIKALKHGEVTIIFSLKANPLYKAKIKINVNYEMPNVFTPTNSLLIGQKTKINISNIDMLHINDKEDILYTSLNENIAIVDNNGVITAINPGEVKINVKNRLCEEISIDYMINVYSKDTDKIVLTTSNELAYSKAGEYLQINANKEANLYDWSSSDTNIASVDGDGKVLGYNTGMAIIIASLKSNSSIKGSITVTIEGTYRVNYLAQFIQIALGEVGTVEKDENITKYGEWYGMDGEPWCAMYVSWCANQAGISKNDIPHYAAVSYFMTWYQNCDRFGLKEEYIPKCGDLIIFKNDGASHIGIVLGVKDGKVYTVEGNTSDMCAKRSYLLNHHTITGYCKPDWPEGCIAPNIDFDGSSSGSGEKTE